MNVHGSFIHHSPKLRTTQISQKKKKKKRMNYWYTLQPGRILNVLLSERSQAVCCCSAAQLCLTLCDRTDCSMTGFSVFHYCPEFAQTHVP